MATNDGGPEPRSYGDMVMNEYLKGLAEIAKEHPSTIEKLEALERAATAGPWAVDGTSKHVKIVHPVSPVDGCVANRSVVCRAMLSGPRHMKYARANMEMCAAARNAMPALLAVAKAAQKSLDQLSYILEVAYNEQQDEVLYPNMLAEIGTRSEELRASLSRLEAK